MTMINFANIGTGTRQTGSGGDKWERPTSNYGPSKADQIPDQQWTITQKKIQKKSKKNHYVYIYIHSDFFWIFFFGTCPLLIWYLVSLWRSVFGRRPFPFVSNLTCRSNKMDNKLLYDHLICHNIDYFHVSIVDMIQVGNNTESQLDELLSRKERKWIWDLCSITPYGLNPDDGYYCQNKRCRKR